MNKLKVVFGDFREKFTIPEEWEISKLEDIVKKIKAGGTPDTKISKYYDGKIPFVSISDLSKEEKYLYSTIKTISSEGLENSAAWRVPKNSLLLSMYATIGKPLINTQEVATHQGILGIIPNEKVDLEFLLYALNYIRTKLVRYFLVGTQANLNLDISKNLKIIHPKTIREQKKIASILGAVDNTINKYGSIIETTKRLKKGLMQKLLTKGIGHTKFKKVKWLFGKEIEVPQEWDVLTIAKTSSQNGIKTGPFGSSLLEKELIGKDVRVLFPDDIQNGEITINGKHITKEKFEELKEFEVKLDDVVISLMGTIGKVGHISKNIGKAIISKHLLKISVAQELCFPQFLIILLNSFSMQSQMNSQSQGLTMKGLNTKIIKNLQGAFPKLQEQRKIVSILSNMDYKINDLEYKKNNFEKLKKGLMQKLLTGQIRV